MSTIENIQQRRSVRSYTGEPLSKEHAGSITNFISELKAPFGANVRISLIRGSLGTGPVKLGTYGWVKGASDFLTLVYEEKPLAEEAAAYVFEQVILYCTGLGLGTCWLGGAFSRKDFGGQVQLQPGERLRVVSPVGTPSDKKRIFIESVIVGAEKNHRSRQPFETRFFQTNFDLPLLKEDTGIYSQPLEMVRISPSANNKQPWRVILDKGKVHFYHCYSLGGFSATDMGIALCHFAETCRELDIAGRMEALPDAPQYKNATYSVSWTTG
jgi:nitroreductase